MSDLKEIAKRQQKIKDFAEREVFYSVSHLVSELVKQDKYMDELLEICSRPYDENDVSEGENLDDYQDDYIEALEHWIVSDWLADKLIAEGEMITKDFLGLTIWGRTTSGQSIFLDGVIERIYNSLNRQTD